MRKGSVALLAALVALAPSPADARVGRPLAEAAAAVRRAGVPSATFAVRQGVVVMEIWRSYVGDDHKAGPTWTPRRADQLRGALAGGARLVSSGAEPVSWASFAVPTFRYADGTTIVHVGKPDAPAVWMIVAGGAWAWRTPYEVVEASCEGWVLARGKLTRRRAASW